MVFPFVKGKTKKTLFTELSFFNKCNPNPPIAHQSDISMLHVFIVTPDIQMTEIRIFQLPCVLL